MRYITSYNENIFRNAKIKNLCDMYQIINYRINRDGSIDVYGDVNLGGGKSSPRRGTSRNPKKLKRIPIKFRYVYGNFNCSSNNLTSLIGCPEQVEGSFNCVGNRTLTSLEGGPVLVSGSYFCGGCALTNLIGSPKEARTFIFDKNPLPKEILSISDKYPIGSSDIIKKILAEQDTYDIWNSDGTFNKSRFNMMMEEIEEDL